MEGLHQKVIEAEKRLRPHVRETPLEYAPALSKVTGCNVYLKLETQQFTGAFKVRGAFNKILQLTPKETQQGIVAASSGNHGAAVAFAMKKLNIPGRIFVPENASKAKIDNIRQYTDDLELYGDDCLIAEQKARAYAQSHNMAYVSPYNDIEVLCGQGSIGVEIDRQLDTIDAVLVPVGGGGLIAGIGAYLKTASPNTKIYGCQPENSPGMAESIKNGAITEITNHPTLSDATAGNIEEDAVTFPLCQSFVDDYFLSSEKEIKEAMYTFIKTQHQLIEGASGLAVATLLKEGHQWQGKNVVLVLSGGNISIETLRGVIG